MLAGRWRSIHSDQRLYSIPNASLPSSPTSSICSHKLFNNSIPLWICSSAISSSDNACAPSSTDMTTRECIHSQHRLLEEQRVSVEGGGRWIPWTHGNRPSHLMPSLFIHECVLIVSRFSFIKSVKAFPLHSPPTRVCINRRSAIGHLSFLKLCPLLSLFFSEDLLLSFYYYFDQNEIININTLSTMSTRKSSSALYYYHLLLSISPTMFSSPSEDKGVYKRGIQLWFNINI